MQYVIVRYDQIPVCAHVHAREAQRERELEAGVDSDRTSRKFVEESMALQNREAPFNRAHCTREVAPTS